ncbi:MAG: hypothetical protein ACRDNK_00745 [Solirubrobacteraceae bacterium]
MRLPVQASEVGAARPMLEALREALAGPAPADLRGLARAACLINDPTGPLYQSSPPGAIARAAEKATAALLAGASVAPLEVQIHPPWV